MTRALIRMLAEFLRDVVVIPVFLLALILIAPLVVCIVMIIVAARIVWIAIKRWRNKEELTWTTPVEL